MTDRGWNQSDLAREAAKHTPDKKFGRDLVSNYIRARILPSPVHLRALAKALNRKEEEILPTRGLSRPAGGLDTTTPLAMKDQGDGNCWLTVNQSVPWAVAMQITQLLSTQATHERVSEDSRSRKTA